MIENAGQALELVPAEKNVLIAQTTFSPTEFESIKKVLEENNPELQVFNSICSATMERQESLLELKGKAEGIIVIGGRNSAKKALRNCRFHMQSRGAHRGCVGNSFRIPLYGNCCPYCRSEYTRFRNR